VRVSAVCETIKSVYEYCGTSLVREKIGVVQNVTRVQLGLANHVFRVVTDRDKYIVKHRGNRVRVRPDLPRDPSAIRDEYAAMRLVGKLLPDGATPTVVHYDFDSAIIITPMLFGGRGSVLQNMFLKSDFRSGIAASLGTMIGQLHAATNASSYFVRESEREDKFRRQQYNWLVRDVSYPKTWLRVECHKAVDLAEKVASRSIIWGDLTPKNILVDSGRVALVDAEAVHRGAGVFDVGWFVGQVLLQGVVLEQERIAIEFIRTWVESYQTARMTGGDRALEPSERKLVCVFAAASIAHRVYSSFLPKVTQLPQVVHKRVLEVIQDLCRGTVFGERTLI